MDVVHHCHVYRYIEQSAGERFRYLLCMLQKNRYIILMTADSMTFDVAVGLLYH